MNTLAIILAAAAALPLCGAAYLATLALASRRATPPDRAPPRLRFDIVVPAHDEAAQIAQTVRGLLELRFPRNLFRVLVVADNCSDDTAALARESGAQVLVRHDPTRRGKGYALAHAFEQLERDHFADAVVVVDADTSVDPDLLLSFAAHLERGARVVQAEYQVRDAARAWRTRLLSLALALFHTTRSLGRERLGLSCGLRGNGMCFTREVLRAVPYVAYSLVEDVEYGLRLGEAGVRVVYAGEVAVRGDMPADARDARSQRRRWEAGRRALERSEAPRLLGLALRRRDAILLDLGLDLLVPPLSRMVGFALALASAAALVPGARLALLESATALGLLTVYVLRGWWLSGTGLRGLADLARAPLYLLWKLTLALRPDPARRGEWVRTARGGEAIR